MSEKINFVCHVYPERICTLILLSFWSDFLTLSAKISQQFFFAFTLIVEILAEFRAGWQQ